MMNINEKIFLKSICGDIHHLIKSDYRECVAPKYMVLKKYGDFVKYQTLSTHNTGMSYCNLYFKCDEPGAVYGAYTNIKKTSKPLLWKNPLEFNYRFSFEP